MYRDDCQHAELPARGELVMHEVHGDRGSDRPGNRGSAPRPAAPHDGPGLAKRTAPAARMTDTTPTKKLSGLPRGPQKARFRGGQKKARFCCASVGGRAPLQVEIDGQFEFGRLHDRQFRRPRPFENSTGIDTSSAKRPECWLRS